MSKCLRFASRVLSRVGPGGGPARGLSRDGESLWQALSRSRVCRRSSLGLARLASVFKQPVGRWTDSESVWALSRIGRVSLGLRLVPVSQSAAAGPGLRSCRLAVASHRQSGPCLGSAESVRALSRFSSQVARISAGLVSKPGRTPESVRALLSSGRLGLVSGQAESESVRGWTLLQVGRLSPHLASLSSRRVGRA